MENQLLAVDTSLCNSIKEEQKYDEENQKEITIKDKQPGITPLIEIKKTETFTMYSFVEQIGLKGRPEDYILQGNSENITLRDRVYVFEIRWKNQTWKKLASDARFKIPKTEKNSDEKKIHFQLFLYLTNCINHPELKKSEELEEFLEISAIDHEGHHKFKECYMIKKAGGRTQESRCVRCGVFWGSWNKRYFCLTSDGISISKNRTEYKIREMLMFDYDFSVNYGIQETGYDKGIRLNSSNRKLTLEAPNLFQFFDFLYCLKIAINESPYLGLHRFASFSPIRQFNNCKWYIDGESYFKDAYKYIMKAEQQIFITDWWLSPQLHLIRPVEQSQETNQGVKNNINQTPQRNTVANISRLDNLLKQKAQQNVDIFIILYKEPTVALTLDSYYTKKSLTYQGIKVLRHPNTLIPFMWSHHEKLLIIDQKIGFIGGLDLCYGRMDNQNHLLFDPVDTIESPPQSTRQEFWPGIDFCNSRTKDFQDVKLFTKSDIDRMKDPRMPWHDVAMRIVGDGVIDLSRHFIQYWNYVLTDLELQKVKEDNNNNNFMLRARQDTSVQKEEAPSIFKKIKRKWKMFKESVIHENESDKDDGQQNLLVRGEDQEGFEVYGGSEENKTFKRQDQHELYFKSLMKEKQESNDYKSEKNEISSNGLSLQKQESKQYQSQSPQQSKQSQQQQIENRDSKSTTGGYLGASQPKQSENSSNFINNSHKSLLERDSGQSINSENNQNKKQEVETKGEINTIKIEQQIPIDKLPSDLRQIIETNTSQEDTHEDIQMEKIQSLTLSQKLSYDLIPKADPRLLITSSAFPTTQRQQSQMEIIEEIPLKKIRSFSSEEKKNKKNESLDQEFLQLLQQVRNAKEEDVACGFYDSNITSPEKKQGSRRKISSDSKLSSENEDECQDIILDNKKTNKYQLGSSECQVVRSSSTWACGVKETECSIHIAYIQMIGQAQHFIYIENQFFISGLAGEPVKNAISQALVSRIIQAQNNDQNFKVIVVLPLLPGFEGEIDGNSSLLKIQLHWEYCTISRGGTSILETLQKQGIKEPKKYIQFYSLRTHSQRPCDQTPVTEIVYVHSKLIIIDDRKVIMGSANINDRSMKGSRDSEIAMIVEDKKVIMSKMNGKDYQAGEFAHTLRVSLFQEHFGLTREELIDPLSNQLSIIIENNAKKNTLIYREVFRCYPDDLITSADKWEEFKQKKNLSKYNRYKDQIIGFAVEFPTQFLKDDNLRLHMHQKEFYMPDYSFT